MGRSRYKIYELTHPHFVTCTILHWLPIFTKKESVDIILNSLKFLQKQDNLKLHAYVILENHLHMVLRSDDLQKSMESFKKFTAREILKLLKKENATTILDQLAFYKKAHRKDKSFQVWEEGYQPKLIQNEAILKVKIDYIHHNLVKRGYVDEAMHWRYSSARDYEGGEGLIEIDKLL
ncbi:MAG: Transposase and inactivated derivatives [uncultured Sulfurovum sp.]|uniref:Transposase and inactivated derivatives n=1 Tax=uncultured Sulfurovum sp. TaxID=269237 RepID=A0A6S6RTF5_9BACT|nr:MAG: Transposase and inactivated derivatives [uncultured Sulfurovum sp.]